VEGDRDIARAVLTRDRHRCRVPGCTHATFVDVHHVQPRSEGGRNEASNLLTLCSVHLRAVHRGQLLIDGGGEGATIFRHADGAAYGSPRAPGLVDVHAKLFSALRHLGFREGEVKAVLPELRGDAELEGASIEHQLREAPFAESSRWPDDEASRGGSPKVAHWSARIMSCSGALRFDRFERVTTVARAMRPSVPRAANSPSGALGNRLPCSSAGPTLAVRVRPVKAMPSWRAGEDFRRSSFAIRTERMSFDRRADTSEGLGEAR
jgi:hypothetical protein